MECKGEPLTQTELSVQIGNTTLVPDKDYTVSYERNTDVGTAYLIIKGNNENGYFGEKKVSFKITGIGIEKARVSGMPTTPIEYTGNAVTDINPTLTLNGQKLEKDNYTISYANNVKAGKASIIFKGRGKYTGTLKKTFNITAYDVNKELVKIEGDGENLITAKYSKGGSRPKPEVRFGNTLLKEGIDYTLSYSNNKALSDDNSQKKPTITIKGKGNFKGTKSINFKIEKQDIGQLKIVVPDKETSSNKESYKSIPRVTDLDGKVLTAGTDYERSFVYMIDGEEIKEVSQPFDVGTKIQVTVTGKGNYEGTLTSDSYRIIKKSIKSAKVKVEDQTYTGKPITITKEQIKEVKVGKDKLLQDEYEIIEGSYQNNIKKGTASVTIRGVGENYGGTKVVNFKIKSKGFLWWWRK